jgi:predicted protein tyrosine phosphatase
MAGTTPGHDALRGCTSTTRLSVRHPQAYNIRNQGTVMIHVCSLADLHATVKDTGASHVLTVMANVAQVQRPESILEANHLRVSMDDITEQTEGFVAPNDAHIAQVLDFVRGWDRNAPLVVHCYAGISRSTASAFAAACMLNPQRDERVIARQIRAASPIASPNRLFVTLADKALARDGRMVRALDEMGPGNMTVVGRPFRIDLE